MIFKKWETTVTCGNLPVSLIIKIRNETLHDHKHTTKPPDLHMCSFPACRIYNSHLIMQSLFVIMTDFLSCDASSQSQRSFS